ncbi:nitrogen fixation protein NifB [Humidesulfovibrio mexicanus]|uniref:Nitrogen fixation protein NifB n=1 Tax=Humidesulfovibrio mexicanus TaxID=147047 RepID=A0A239B4K8_9BACT|nr:radical SAM protein [Humidesulfovibrio mexicanus]SNS02154.1 nitrogen fixation protein NifB [Humidesulfovibrio mexicanus]
MACQKTSPPQSGCIHLPVAVRANTRRVHGEPGNPGRALPAADALQWLDRVLADPAAGPNIRAVSVSGPGEPLADPVPVAAVFRAVHEKRPELELHLLTNGLCPPEADISAVARDMAQAGVTRATVLMDAVDPALVERLYAWIRPGRRTMALEAAAPLLVDAQARAVRAFREAGMLVAVRMAVVPGVNEGHVEELAHVVASLGADLLDIVAAPAALPDASAVVAACAPEECASCGQARTCGAKPAKPDSSAEGRPAPLSPERLEELRVLAARRMALLPADDPCRADVQWMENAGPGAGLCLENPGLPRPSGARVNVAVASSGGMEVDLHLGQAVRFMIFGPRADDGLPSLLGLRDLPEAAGPGGGDARWEALASALPDCFAILAASAGSRPREVLSGLGLGVLAAETDVKGAVDLLFGGGPRRKKPGAKRVIVD